MKIGWLVDTTDTPGGAELTQAEFRRAAPQGIEIVDCPPGGIVADLDHYVIQNCVKYSLEDLRATEGKPITKYWHDVGPWLSPEVRYWLDTKAFHICCSPIQAKYMGLPAEIVAPAVNLDPFDEACAHINGSRKGTVCVGSWRNYGKAPHKALEWARDHQRILEFFGSGPYAPPGSVEVAYADMPLLLASYETFVYLPIVLEPFGRVVVEAWAAGCEIVTNSLVGAKYWIEQQPDDLWDAADDFWIVVLR